MTNGEGAGGNPQRTCEIHGLSYDPRLSRWCSECRRERQQRAAAAGGGTGFSGFEYQSWMGKLLAWTVLIGCGFYAVRAARDWDEAPERQREGWMLGREGKVRVWVFRDPKADIAVGDPALPSLDEDSHACVEECAQASEQCFADVDPTDGDWEELPCLRGFHTCRSTCGGAAEALQFPALSYAVGDPPPWLTLLEALDRAEREDTMTDHNPRRLYVRLEYRPDFEPTSARLYYAEVGAGKMHGFYIAREVPVPVHHSPYAVMATWEQAGDVWRSILEQGERYGGAGQGLMEARMARAEVRLEEIEVEREETEARRQRYRRAVSDGDTDLEFDDWEARMVRAEQRELSAERQRFELERARERHEEWKQEQDEQREARERARARKVEWQNRRELEYIQDRRRDRDDRSRFRRQYGL